MPKRPSKKTPGTVARPRATRPQQANERTSGPSNPAVAYLHEISSAYNRAIELGGSRQQLALITVQAAQLQQASIDPSNGGGDVDRTLAAIVAAASDPDQAARDAFHHKIGLAAHRYLSTSRVGSLVMWSPRIGAQPGRRSLFLADVRCVLKNVHFAQLKRPEGYASGLFSAAIARFPELVRILPIEAMGNLTTMVQKLILEKDWNSQKGPRPHRATSDMSEDAVVEAIALKVLQALGASKHQREGWIRAGPGSRAAGTS